MYLFVSQLGNYYYLHALNCLLGITLSFDRYNDYALSGTFFVWVPAALLWITVLNLYLTGVEIKGNIKPRGSSHLLSLKHIKKVDNYAANCGLFNFQWFMICPRQYLRKQPLNGNIVRGLLRQIKCTQARKLFSKNVVKMPAWAIRQQKIEY